MLGKLTDGTRNGLYLSAQASVALRDFNRLYFFPLHVMIRVKVRVKVRVKMRVKMRVRFGASTDGKSD